MGAAGGSGEPRGARSPQRDARAAGLQRGRLGAGHWSIRVGEREQVAPACTCAGQSGPRGRCDRVAYAFSRVRSHTMPALDKRSCSGPGVARVGAERAVPGTPGARHRSGSAVLALTQGGGMDAAGVEGSAAPGRGWSGLPGASESVAALCDGVGSRGRRSGLYCNAGGAPAGGSGGCRSRPVASHVSPRCGSAA